MRNQKFIKSTDHGNLGTTAQNLTNSWATYPSTGTTVIPCDGYNTLTLWIEIDANNSVNIQFQVRLLRDTLGAGNEYRVPIYTVDADKVRFQPEYYELDVDGTDTNIVEKWDISEAKYFKLYVKCDTVGATAGQIESVYYDLSTAIA